MIEKSKDIRSTPLPALDWDPAKRAESLATLVEHAGARARTVTEWYLKAKAGKRVAARLLRLGAILLTAGAGILPIIQQIFVTDGKPLVAPAWASVLVACAVLLIAIDRFFGFSSAWMRYISAELAIKRAREAFEMDWQAASASFAGQAPTDDQVRAGLALIRAFTDQVNAVVADETSRWVAEFQEALRQIDEKSKTPVVVSRTGSLAISVDNGESVDPPGWELRLNDVTVATYIGKTAALPGLESRDHLVRVTATMHGKEVRAEGVAQVRPGAVATLHLSLA